jgi:excisionase family DNA binding protein
MQEIDNELYLTGDEATALLGVKRATLYAYVSRGVLRSYRKGVGRERLYRQAEIEALLTVRADAPSPRHIAEPPTSYQAQAPAISPPSPTDDGTFRDVSLPGADTWAGDH